MPDLYITKATPNPAGRDRIPAHQATNAQLNGEWVEFQNTSGKNLSLDDVHLDHNTYDGYCRKTGEARLVTFKGSLVSGKSIRVHSGSGQGAWEGDLFHFYADHGNFVWNNRCGDVAYLRTATNGLVDWASHDPNPGEGALLRRIANTNKLA